MIVGQSTSNRESAFGNQLEDQPSVKGVSVLGFRPGSTAQKACVKKDDVIIEYWGAGELTTDKLAVHRKTLYWTSWSRPLIP